MELMHFTSFVSKKFIRTKFILSAFANSTAVKPFFHYFGIDALNENEKLVFNKTYHEKNLKWS